jgi:hypothetical protein
MSNTDFHALPSKLLYIDSRDATTYLATKLDGNETIDLTSYFTYVLKENIEIPHNQRVLIALHSATIPYSFYNIREGVNDSVKMALGGAEQEVVVPAGNYSTTSFGDYVSTQFVSKWSGVINSMDMDFDEDTQKFNITINADAQYLNNSHFDFDNELKDAHIEMGFRPEIVPFVITSGANNTFDYKITSQNVVDINGSIHGVYIRSNLVSKGTLDSQNGVLSNILARLPLSVQSGGILFLEPRDSIHKSVVDLRTINAITLRLTDERNRILDLNGLHFQICISLDFVYAQKPENLPYGRSSSGSSYVNSYGVVNDLTGSQKIQMALEQRRDALQQELEEQERRRGPGRPRRVGRPKGS